MNATTAGAEGVYKLIYGTTNPTNVILSTTDDTEGILSVEKTGDYYYAKVYDPYNNLLVSEELSSD